MVQPCRSLRSLWGSFRNAHLKNNSVAEGIRVLKTAQYAALLALSIALLFVAGVIPAHAFENQIASGGAPIHEDITTKGLKFLQLPTLNLIKDANARVDFDFDHLHNSNAHIASYHFDNCNFLESTDRINQMYAEAVAALDPQNQNLMLDKAAEAFVQLLHIVQDFYAHSSWVELQWVG